VQDVKIGGYTARAGLKGKELKGKELLILIQRQDSREIANADELLTLLTTAFPHLHPVLFSADRKSRCVCRQEQ
jgi:hypothetical protein